MQKEVGQLRELVGELVDQFQNSRTPHLPDDAAPHFRKLIDAGIGNVHASAIVKEALDRRDLVIGSEKPSIEKLVREALVSRLATTGATTRKTKGKPTVIALVGPTGVGKTTTVAKLAANLKLKENARVALVTIDTYRIAAIDQLKKYADIIDAPLAVVNEPREVQDAIARVADYDFVIIDTAGRSPRDAVKLAELTSSSTAADPAEMHLVLSSNHGIGSLRWPSSGSPVFGPIASASPSSTKPPSWGHSSTSLPRRTCRSATSPTARTFPPTSSPPRPTGWRPSSLTTPTTPRPPARPESSPCFLLPPKVNG